MTTVINESSTGGGGTSRSPAFKGLTLYGERAGLCARLQDVCQWDAPLTRRSPAARKLRFWNLIGAG